MGTRSDENDLRIWLDHYPNPAETPDANRVARDDEGAFLSPFAGAALLELEDLKAILERNPLTGILQGANRWMASLDPAKWPTTSERIAESLATDDDVIALINLTAPDGVAGLGVPAATMILAVLRPDRYVTLSALARRGLIRRGLLGGDPELPPSSSEWRGFLMSCRELSESSGLGLRDVGRALVGGGSLLRLPDHP